MTDRALLHHRQATRCNIQQRSYIDSLPAFAAALCIGGVTDIIGLRAGMKQFMNQVIGHHIVVEAETDEVSVEIFV